MGLPSMVLRGRILGNCGICHNEVPPVHLPLHEDDDFFKGPPNGIQS